MSTLPEFDFPLVTELPDFRSDDLSASAGHVIQFSLLDGKTDTCLRPITEKWEQFKDRFSYIDQRTQKDGPAFLPGSTLDNTRKRGYVYYIYGLTLDCDGKKEKYSAQDIQAALKGYGYLAYQTYSATPDQPRWRVFIPTDRPIPPDRLSQVLEGMTLLGLKTDAATTHPNAIHYLPSCPPGENRRVIIGKGKLLDPTKVLKAKTNQLFAKPESKVSSPKSAATRENSRDHSFGMLKLSTPSDLKIKNEVSSNVLKSSFHDVDMCVLMASAMGLPTTGLKETGRKGQIRSILPGHYDEHPSTGLLVSHSGSVLFKDFSGHFSQKTYTLPQLRATVAYKKLYIPSGPELAVWELLLLYEADLLDLTPVDIPPLPTSHSKSVRKIYDGFKLLLGLKWRYKGGHGKPTAFSKRFASAWCGVTESSAHRSKLRLMDSGIISMVKPYEGRKSCGQFLPGRIRPQKYNPNIEKVQQAYTQLINDGFTKNAITLDALISGSGLTEKEILDTKTNYLWERNK